MKRGVFGPTISSLANSAYRFLLPTRAPSRRFHRSSFGDDRTLGDLATSSTLQRAADPSQHNPTKRLLKITPWEYDHTRARWPHARPPRVWSAVVPANNAMQQTVQVSRALRPRLRPTSPRKVARKARAARPAADRERWADHENEGHTC